MHLKIKQRREDFVVREIPQGFRLGQGDFAAYQLDKSGIGTVEALEEIRRAWEIPAFAIGYGGRKDRHAQTSQYVTIRGGPREDFGLDHFSLKYLGQAQEAFTAKHIQGNEFEIRLRGLSLPDAERFQEAARNLSLVPNYFDEQRFGSVSAAGEFVARSWCLGDYERAIFLALAEENPRDGRQEREQRSLLRENWGAWSRCKDLLKKSNRRSVVTYLVDHPEGFKKAAALISRDMRSLYVAAFQSRLWNEIVSEMLKMQTSSCHHAESIAGLLRFPTEAQECRQLEVKAIPLPSARPTRWPRSVKTILEQVCQRHEIAPHKLRFSHPRDVFFSRASRDVFLQVTDMETAIESIETASDKTVQEHSVQLRFVLKSGQYATMLLRGLELSMATNGEDLQLKIHEE